MADAKNWQDQDVALPDLPNGRLITPGTPPMWLTHEPLAHASAWWSRLSLQQELTGLRPVLVDRPGSVRSPYGADEVDKVDVDREFARAWYGYRELALLCESEPGTFAELSEEYQAPPEDPGPPFADWPGLAPAAPAHPDPDAEARAAVAELAPWLRSTPYVGLLPAERAADLPALLGWRGAGDHVDVRVISAVLRTWEDRFGAVLLGFEESELHVSVASPPTTREHCDRVALEHFLLCPDNVYQSPSRTFPGYAESLAGERIWTLSWS